MVAINPAVQKIVDAVAPGALAAGSTLTDQQATLIIAHAREAHIPENLIDQALQAGHFTHKTAVTQAVHATITADTRSAQTILLRLNYLQAPNTADGRLGPNTRDAIVQFQTEVMQMAHPTGILDQATMDELKSARDNTNIDWARERLPAAEARFTKVARDGGAMGRGEHRDSLRFPPERLARMSDEELRMHGINTDVRNAAAHLVALRNVSLPDIRTNPTALASLEQARQGVEFSESLTQAMGNPPTA